MIEGSRVLDCFAGSGALGLEAASRGAASVVLIERSAIVANTLRSNVAALGADQVQVHRADALEWLARTSPVPADLCFLDPPFSAGLLDTALARLVDGGWLAEDALLYIETDRAALRPALPVGWQWLREKHAGQVRYGLVQASEGDLDR